MAVYNSEKYLKESVESILAQTFRDFELIVIDDGSRDNTPAILQSFTDKRIRIITNPENIGLPNSLNIGIKESLGCYIARQDADDISLPERLQKQFDYLEKHTKIAVLGTAAKVIQFGGKIKPQRKTPLVLPTFQDCLKGTPFTHGSVVIRKEFLDNACLYDDFFGGVEDYELWLRIAKHFPIANLREPLYMYRLHDGQVTRKNQSSSLLLSLLAKNRALGNVNQALLQQTKAEGSESYYRHLSLADKCFYHLRMGRTCGSDSKALEHYSKAINLQGLKALTFKALCHFAMLRLKLLFQDETKPSNTNKGISV